MRRKKRYARAAAAGAVTAMAAAALFVGTGPAVADGCTFDSGGHPYCWVDVDTGGDWYPWPGDGGGGGGGGYESGGDGGGGDGGDPDPTGTTLPVIDSAANKSKGVAAQENAHRRMFDGQCFSTVTGLRPTDANRRSFATVAENYTVRGRTGQSPNGTGFTDEVDADGRHVVTIYDDFDDRTQPLRDAAWLVIYSAHYGDPSTPRAIVEHCLAD